MAEILKRERAVVSSCSVKIGRSASRVLTSGNLLILASCLRDLSKCREQRPRGVYTLNESKVYMCDETFRKDR